MGQIDQGRGKFVEEGDYEDEERQPGILEQAERIMRGLPGIPKYDIFAQAERIKRGLPGIPKQGILAQAERIMREDEARLGPDEPEYLGEHQTRGDAHRISTLGRINE